MKLAEYKEVFNNSQRKATLCFLVKNGEILLALKKRGLGEGKWNGVGGKLEPGETVEDAVFRETEEEVKVKPISFRQVATLDFYFPQKPDWSQRVLVFLIDKWEGEPAETEEMAPKWFKVANIPFESMWADDFHWLPLVLKGKIVAGEFLFQGEKILEFNLATQENLEF